MSADRRQTQPDDALSPLAVAVCLSAAAAGWVLVELLSGMMR